MSLEWLALVDFRCHEVLDFTPETGVNVLIGDNGAGKTSILEGIAYASMLRSFRHTPDTALIRSGRSEAIVRAGLAGTAAETKIEIAVPLQGRRSVYLNGKRPRANAELAQVFPVVTFLPDDLSLVKGGPARRRDFLDDLAARLQPQAAAAQSEYQRAVRQRNTLLRREGPRADAVTLDVWDERLSAAGGEVLAHRLALLDRLTPTLAEAYTAVSGKGVLRPAYRAPWVGDLGNREPAKLAADLREALQATRGRDLEIRVTTRGPHRDVPSFELDGRSLRTQASQGEQRTVSVALRLASYRLLEDHHGAPPTLLLDDIFSELDPARAEGLLGILPRGQVFVTSARDDEVPVAGRRWQVTPGEVR